MEQKYIVALEIGSSHIRAAVGVVDESGVLTILAVEDENAINVVRYGWIQNVEEVSNRINKLIKKLENYQSISPRKIKSVYVSIGGRSTMATSRQIVRHFDDGVDITDKIIQQIKDEARQMVVSDRKVIEVLPREFAVDNLDCPNPVGTVGRNIKAEINLVTCKPVIGYSNIQRAVTERQQLNIKGEIVRQSAIADLVLTSDEKKLGCMLVDFGPETTTVSMYKNGTLRYFETLPLGSRNITRDIMSLNHTEENAEQLKKVLGDVVNVEPNYRKHDFDGDATEVNNYVRARAGEIIVNIIEQPKYAGYKISSDLPGGIIIVGAGAKLKGFTDQLASQSGLNLRLGNIPGTIRISDPKLQSLDFIDVIALLNAAARRNPQECTEVPVQVNVTYDYDDSYDEDDDDEPGPRPIKGKEKKEKKEKKPKVEEKREPKGPSKLSQWKDRLATMLFNEADENDE